jgi:hypothetical protein
MIYVYVLLGVVGLAAVLIAARTFVDADPQAVARFLRRAALVLGGLVALVVVVFLLETGRLIPLLVPLIMLGTFLRRFVSLRGLWRSVGGGASQGTTTNVETDTLRMHLDHETGTISGVVRQGPFSGRKLDELARPDLFALWRRCRADDPQAAQLLEAYLDRLDPHWRAEEAADQARAQAGETRARAPDAMTRAEALDMLGLAEGADAEAIKDAHRRLMMKLHPDHGGTDYLAAKLNRAREILLGS